jgi:hypothetical protein
MRAINVPTTTRVPCGYRLVGESAAFGTAPAITLPTSVARLLIQNSAPAIAAVLLVHSSSVR